MGFTKFLISPSRKIKIWQTDASGNPHHGPVLVALDKKYQDLYDKDKAHLTDAANRSGYSESLNAAIQDGWVRGRVWSGSGGTELFIQARDITHASQTLPAIPENLVNNADQCVIETLDKKNLHFPISHEDSLLEDMTSYIVRKRAAPLVYAKKDSIIRRISARDNAFIKEQMPWGLSSSEQEEWTQTHREAIERADAEQSPADIKQIASQMKFIPIKKKAINYAFVQPDALRPLTYCVSKERSTIETHTADGKETTNTAEIGDIIFSGPSGERYVLKPAKVQKLYTGTIGAALTPEQTPRQVARYDGQEMSFVAPWGENMVIKPGDYLVREQDGSGYYRIAKKEFEQTYQV